MSLNAIFRYPNLYHTAMAIAFVSNQRFYDTIYQERYMGLPEDNEEGYKDGSPITHAANLEGDLLLIVAELLPPQLPALQLALLTSAVLLWQWAVVWRAGIAAWLLLVLVLVVVVGLGLLSRLLSGLVT